MTGQEYGNKSLTEDRKKECWNRMSLPKLKMYDEAFCSPTDS